MSDSINKVKNDKIYRYAKAMKKFKITNKKNSIMKKMSP